MPWFTFAVTTLVVAVISRITAFSVWVELSDYKKRVWTKKGLHKLLQTLEEIPMNKPTWVVKGREEELEIDNKTNVEVFLEWFVEGSRLGRTSSILVIWGLAFFLLFMNHDSGNHIDLFWTLFGKTVLYYILGMWLLVVIFNRYLHNKRAFHRYFVSLEDGGRDLHEIRCSRPLFLTLRVKLLWKFYGVDPKEAGHKKDPHGFKMIRLPKILGFIHAFAMLPMLLLWVAGSMYLYALLF